MKCDFDYCIYNRDFSCLLKNVQVNAFGMCESCIIVSIPDHILQELKKKQLGEIDRRWKDYD